MKKVLHEHSARQILRVLNNQQFQSEPIKLTPQNNNSVITPPKHKFLAICQGIMMASAPIDILWAIICLISVGVVTTAILLSVFGAASVVVGAIIGVHHYKKLKKENIKRINEYNNLLLQINEINDSLQKQDVLLVEEIKNFCTSIKHLASLLDIEEEIDSILKRWKLNHFDHNDMTSFVILAKNPGIRKNIINELCEKFSARGLNLHYQQSSSLKKNINKDMEDNAKQDSDKGFIAIFYKSRMSRTVIEGLGLASILFVSFFWCSTYVTATLGLLFVAAALSSPVGIGIALGISVVVGLFYAKHLYDKLSIVHDHKKECKNLKIELQTKNNQLGETSDQLKTLKRINEKINQATDIHQYILRREQLQTKQSNPRFFSGAKPKAQELVADDELSAKKPQVPSAQSRLDFK